MPIKQIEKNNREIKVLEKKNNELIEITSKLHPQLQELINKTKKFIETKSDKF